MVKQIASIVSVIILTFSTVSLDAFVKSSRVWLICSVVDNLSQWRIRSDENLDHPLLKMVAIVRC